MADKNDSGIHTVIEIGTENIKVLIGGLDSSSVLVLGHGEMQSNSCGGGSSRAGNVRKGEVLNVKAVQTLLDMAVREAESVSGASVSDGKVYIGVTGRGLQTYNAEATIELSRQYVTEGDMERVIRAARERCYGRRDEICLQTYTRFFRMDDGSEYYESVGQAGKSLTACIQSVIYRNNRAATLPALVSSVVGVTPQMLYIPLSLGFASLEETNLGNGFLALDIGAGVTSYSVSSLECFVQTGHIPVGTNQIENDLMEALDIEWDVARRLLRRMDSEIHASLTNPDDGRNRMANEQKRRGVLRPRKLPVSSIERVVRLRLSEIYTLVKDELIERDAWRRFSGGIVLSGGAAMLPGARELAESIFGRETHIAKVSGIQAQDTQLFDDPRWTVPFGLLNMAVRDDEIRRNVETGRSGEQSLNRAWRRLFKMLVNW